MTDRGVSPPSIYVPNKQNNQGGADAAGGNNPDTPAAPAKAIPSIDAALPSMSAKELATLQSNAERLAVQGDVRQQTEAARLLPLIANELEKRREAAPRSVKKAPRKTKAPAKAK